MIKVNLQLFADNAAAEDIPQDDQVSAQGSQEIAEVTETAIPEGIVETKSEEEESATPRQSKEENSFFKTMRLKAEKEAEAKLEATLKQRVDEELKKFKDKLAPVLPDGYADVDEYLNSIDAESTQEEIEVAEEVIQQQVTQANPALDEAAIDKLVAQKLEAIPEIKALREKDAKDKADEMVVRSYEVMKEKFPDIKTPEDVPFEVWGMWNEGKSGRDLISCMKEYRYDNDIAKAAQKGAAIVKGQMNSVAHTGAVAGGGGGSVQMEEEIKIPVETQRMLKEAGVPKDKWGEYYKKYHR